MQRRPMVTMPSLPISKLSISKPVSPSTSTHCRQHLGLPNCPFGALFTHNIYVSVCCGYDALRLGPSASDNCGPPPGKPLPA